MKIQNGIKAIGVLGAGTWGMALARLLSNKGNHVIVWSSIPSEIDELSKNRVQKNLPGMVIPEKIAFTKDIEEAVLNQDILLFAVPSPFVRSVAEQVIPHLQQGQIIVDVAKGIEKETNLTMSEVIEDVLQKNDFVSIPVVALSGPTHAEEVAMDMPTTIVAANCNLDIAECIQDVFMTDTFRVYTSGDKRGVELGGALKNIIAFAVGISNGLGYGDNAKAALITRGMLEITQLGISMGCQEQTFNGLTGIGDLIVTATSKHSRNNKAGYLVGCGYTASQAVKEVGMVVEGLYALPAAKQLADKYKVDTPVIDAVDAIVGGLISPRNAVIQLMCRKKKMEFI